VKNVIGKFLRRMIPSLDEHLADDRLASLFCHELPFIDNVIARAHLATCWCCHLRQEKLEGQRADRMLDLCQEMWGNSDNGPLFDQTRSAFAARLQAHIQQVPARARWTWSFSFTNISLRRLVLMNPIYVVVFAFGFLTAASLLFWWQHKTPDITSNTLLVRAARWDSHKVGISSGVVNQVICISTSSGQTINRSIYRDLQGMRRPKPTKLDEGQKKLVQSLAKAGVDWDEPISASDYQTWHDRRHERIDKIVPAGSHLLKLTTTVPHGDVSSESLVVRDTDFHPVRRTVAFRDSEIVEIAELDYKILPWSVVDSNLFEPFSGNLHTASDAPRRIMPFPATVSEGQLDEAELSTRLVLNQLHADAGEQIEIRRKPQEIEVTGVVVTDERKRQLQTQLLFVPHVVISLQSTTDLKKSAINNSSNAIQVASMPEQRSSLAIYLEVHGRSVGESNRLAQSLFSTALTINQESKAIADLRLRFGAKSKKSIFTSATLEELIYSHQDRLTTALQQERQLLIELQESLPRGSAPSQLETGSLLDSAEKNLALAKELTESEQTAHRNPRQILVEMFRMEEMLKDEAHRVYTTTQSNAALSEKE
jgi:hypothetical protein